MTEIIWSIALESWNILAQMSPYLLLGFLIAGILSICINPTWIESQLGQNGITPILKASALGVPLPLCSCSVIPVAASINKHGASKGATAAFLLSTPQTGVDSILITYQQLGLIFAIFRPLAALLTGILGGLLCKLFDTPVLKPEDLTSITTINESSECMESCCDSTKSKHWLMRILHYGCITLPADIGPSLVLGIAVAGTLSIFVEPKALEAYLGGSIFSIIVLMAAGVPIYVCATASVPLAVGFMHMGASPGAALAFLIAGPATNAAAITAIWRILGKRCAIIYLISVALSAMLSGLALDSLFPLLKERLPEWAQITHEHETVTWTSHAGGILLLGLLLFATINSWQKRRTLQKASFNSENKIPHLTRTNLVISGMTCSHCADNVKATLLACKGIKTVHIDLSQGQVVIQSEDFCMEDIQRALTKKGFSAKLLNN